MSVEFSEMWDTTTENVDGLVECVTVAIQRGASLEELHESTTDLIKSAPLDRVAGYMSVMLANAAMERAGAEIVAEEPWHGQ